ncbi:Tetrapyrrole biosynthesis uroporphyrinogen III synthase [Rhizoctonia solani]|uniref:Tetrapyrrole biosynthesis uroporphyrinogen III synthase n=1 Tax=Rhizoctonia solani TaxID=456999 RepID=A0A8H7M5C1_9AGAM|nr:Tetrapyrrole biosynthesis uroporphyrinogen III synthase [Rhizoctonia solani]
MLNHVLLLKNPDEKVPDPYQYALSRNGFTTSIISTLIHSYIDLDGLTDIIAQEGEKYGGVIVTSGRAVDAWGNAAKEVQEQAQLSATENPSSWALKPFYVVGSKTERKLLGLKWLKCIPEPELILGAKESGTGEAARQNAGGVGKGLKAGGLGFKMVQVYETSASTTFEEDFEEGVKEGTSRSSSEVIIVFFAPSSAELALPVIRKHFSLSSSSEEKPRAKLVAIGPTTSRALFDNHSIQVDTVSSKPDPQSLADAIQYLSTL